MFRLMVLISLMVNSSSRQLFKNSHFITAKYRFRTNKMLLILCFKKISAFNFPKFSKQFRVNRNENISNGLKLKFLLCYNIVGEYAFLT